MLFNRITFVKRFLGSCITKTYPLRNQIGSRCSYSLLLPLLAVLLGYIRSSNYQSDRHNSKIGNVTRISPHHYSRRLRKIHLHSRSSARIYLSLTGQTFIHSACILLLNSSIDKIMK